MKFNGKCDHGPSRNWWVFGVCCTAMRFWWSIAPELWGLLRIYIWSEARLKRPSIQSTLSLTYVQPSLPSVPAVSIKAHNIKQWKEMMMVSLQDAAIFTFQEPAGLLFCNCTDNEWESPSCLLVVVKLPLGWISFESSLNLPHALRELKKTALWRWNLVNWNSHFHVQSHNIWSSN